MPTIPRLSTGVQSTQQLQAPATTPMRDQSAAPFEGIGRSLAAAGALLARTGQETLRDLDAAEVRSRDLQAAEVIGRGLQGYSQITGIAARDKRDSTEGDIRRQLANIEKGITDPVLQREWKAGVDARMVTARLQMDSHLATQARAAAIGQTQASLDNRTAAYQDALAQPDPAVRAMLMDVQRETALRDLDELGRLRGWGSEEAAKARRETLTAMHTGALRTLADDYPEEARAYLDQFGGEMDPDAREQAKGLVKRATLNDRAQRLADGIAPGRPLAERLAAIGKQYSDGKIGIELRDEARRRLASDDSLAQQAELTDRQAALADAQTEMQLNGSITADTRSRLDATGAGPAFDLWTAQGNQFFTTPLGAALLGQAAANPEMVRRQYPTAESRSVLQAQLSVTDFARLENLLATQQDPQRLDSRTETLALLQGFKLSGTPGAEFLTTEEAGRTDTYRKYPELARRREQWELEVRSQARLYRGMDPLDALNKAVEDVNARRTTEGMVEATLLPAELNSGRGTVGGIEFDRANLWSTDPVQQAAEKALTRATLRDRIEQALVADGYPANVARSQAQAFQPSVTQLQEMRAQLMTEANRATDEARRVEAVPVNKQRLRDEWRLGVQRAAKLHGTLEFETFWRIYGPDSGLTEAEARDALAFDLADYRGYNVIRNPR